MKLLTLKKLIIHNFMGYRDEELDFEDKDIVGIIAEYANDDKRSNRAGKTTIPEAICYNLVGLSRYKSDIKLIHHGQKEMFVECVYTNGERDYTIKRGRDYKGKGILELDWIQKNSEVEEAIEDLFGINKKDFLLTSFFKQADINGFMDKKPDEKTTFLMQWLDNNHWKEKEDKVNEDKKELKDRLKLNENIKKALEASLEIDESLESVKNDLKLEVKELNKELDEYKIKLSDKEAKISDFDSKKSKLTKNLREIEEEIDSLSEDIEKSLEHQKQVDKNKKEYSEKKKQLEALSEYQSVDFYEKLLREYLEKQSSIVAKIKSSEKNKGVCPILNSSCSSISYTKEQIEQLKKELEDIDLKINLTSTDKFRASSKKQIEHDIEVITLKAKSFNQKAKELPELEEKHSKKVKEKNVLKEEISSMNIQSLISESNEIKSEMRLLKEKIKEKENKVFDMELRLAEALKAKTKIDTVIEENQKLQNELSLLNYCSFMFGKNGIPSAEIENAFQEVEDNINYILEKLAVGVSISFSPDKEIKALEPMCSCGFSFPKGFRGAKCPECDTPRQKQRREEINFRIIENGIESDFEGDSGGGKQVVSYAVRIALTMLKRSQRKCNLNMLFLDEVDSALDPFLAKQIISSVTNFLTKELGYQQIILVSHKEEIKNSVPYMLKVTKHENHSTASFV